ncbi:MAG: hypothetical protein ACI4LX_07720 [Treponema sp.]
MQVFIIAGMCIINLILWLVFFIKFKRLFTVDDEIQKARSQYELLINDINRNTLQNIDLIDSKIEELNELVKLADTKILLAHDEIQKSRNENILKSSIAKSYSRKAPSVTNYAKTVIDQDSAFEVNVKKARGRKKMQTELFDESENPVSIKKASNVHVVDSEGNAYGEVPVISPKIYMSDNPIAPKRNFHEQVRQLVELGYDVEQIASKLNKSTTEVQFIIDML